MFTVAKFLLVLLLINYNEAAWQALL
uniref:Uncharacterized protein n=1 Tax=Rhizophora mucronata TaxID=61149 RepID=A0A2P2ND95_RHIMU